MKIKVLLPLFVLTFSLTQTTLAEEYLNPGTVYYKQGNLKGGDYLYKLPNDFRLYVEIVRPETDKGQEVGEEVILTELSYKFKEQGLLVTNGSNSQFNLPFFHVLIMYYPIQDGFAAYVAGRLFEEVKVDRIQLTGQATVQAITWEKQQLLVSPKEQFTEELKRTVNLIVSDFSEKYKYFNEQKGPDPK